MKAGAVGTNETCACLRQSGTSGKQRAESGCKRGECQKVYKGEQDLSGVLKADSPLGRTRMVAAGRKRRNRR